MTKEKPFDGTVKFNPRPKNAVDRKADAFLEESRDPARRSTNDALTKHAERTADAIIEKRGKGK
jgi:hypothetical protein